MSVAVKAWDIVHKPQKEVWDAIVNPNKITRYFTSSVSGAIAKGKSITWEFADYNVSIDIEVIEVIENKFISFKWEASGKEKTVEIKLTTEDQFTKIEIRESTFQLNNEDLEKVIQQTQGWTHFICSLKAWLYTGVNLRTGKIT